ncbi:MAG: WecB/TagA/CpsF family glycosyltransferase [Lachnospiraceae bacterium]|jgi:UDP-N-acetyl-D-mannosaminuronic acid transferase (WecB/TagA/CpsF family)|nr:WecB/TagA/CpsF family glycosyltransferase [Lachnospiraceae bacterium]MCI1328895.1 WecB/TagA/CpsF family glycosyltransferase [Lachnospiraceae bacterium]
MIEDHNEISPRETEQEKIRIGRFLFDLLNLDQTMERLSEFVQNDHLNTFAFLSRTTLIEAREDPHLSDYLRRLDAGVASETEVLEAAGITGGRVYEETAGHEYFERIFWQIVKGGLGVFLLCEDEPSCARLAKYLEETFPGIRIVGRTGQTEGSGVDSDHVLNLINSENPDLIITGLNGNRQNLFMIQNQTKVLGKIWMNLGQSPHLLEAVGYKQGWLTRRRIKRYFCDIFVENE